MVSRLKKCCHVKSRYIERGHHTNCCRLIYVNRSFSVKCRSLAGRKVSLSLFQTIVCYQSHDSFCTYRFLFPVLWVKAIAHQLPYACDESCSKIFRFHFDFRGWNSPMIKSIFLHTIQQHVIYSRDYGYIYRGCLSRGLRDFVPAQRLVVLVNALTCVRLIYFGIALFKSGMHIYCLVDGCKV